MTVTPSFSYHGFTYVTLADAEAARLRAERSGLVATHGPAGQRHVIWNVATGESIR